MLHIFLVNPYAGSSDFATKIRDRIPNDIEYYVFTTTKPGGEADLVRQIRGIFENEELRFYCCGGSGTFRNAMNGIDDFSQVEMAYIPYGLTNDFLKVFDCPEDSFRDIDAMVHGDVIDIDYIRTDHGVGLNTFSTGIDVSFMSAMEQQRIFGTFHEMLPYFLALIHSVFFAKPQSYHVEVDGKETYDGPFGEVYMGNGKCIGGFINFQPKADILDGRAHFVLLPGVKGLPIINIIKKLNRQTLDPERDHYVSSYGTRFRITRSDHAPFPMNFDGEINEAFEEWNCEIVPKGLRFVIPKGVNVDGL